MSKNLCKTRDYEIFAKHELAGEHTKISNWLDVDTGILVRVEIGILNARFLQREAAAE